MFFCHASLSVSAPLPSPKALDKVDQQRVFVHAYESIISATKNNSKVTNAQRNKAAPKKAASAPKRKGKAKPGDETEGTGSVEVVPLGRKAKAKAKAKAKPPKGKGKGKGKPDDDIEGAYESGSGSETESEDDDDMEEVLDELREHMDSSADEKTTKRGRPSRALVVSAAPKVEVLWQFQRKSELVNPARLPYMLEGAKFYAPVYRYLKREKWDLHVQM